MEIANLRPQKLNDFFGKINIKNNLEIFINASKKNKKVLDHILFHGLAGTGKTSLAHIIANEYDKKLRIIQGTQIKKISDLMNFISLITEGDFIFIDEIHAISIECMETLYSILEDFCIDLKIGVENNTKVTRVSIPQFTLIAATTNINKLPKPLEDRFAINFFFDLYEIDELILIIKNNASKMNLYLNEREVNIIATCSKGIPRIAINLLKRIYDFRCLYPKIEIENILEQLQIFDYGLKDIDIKYLTLLINNSDPLGLKTIANILELDQTILENKIEPYLLKNNFIKKTAKGRQITKQGIQLMNKIVKYENNQPN